MKIGKSHLFMDVFVLVWTVVMSFALFCGRLQLWIAMVAVYRIVDIVSYRVFFLLVKSQEKPWKEDILRRSLVIAVVNFYEIVVGFAVLYLYTGCIVQAGTPNPLPGAGAAFYYSLVTMTTLGYGEYVPLNNVGRVLVVAQLTTTIIFLLFLLPALVSVFSSRLTRDSENDRSLS